MADSALKIEKLIVGLGNPGEEYAATRHNLGWTALDAFLSELGIKKNFTGGDKKARVQAVEVDHKGVLLVKPTTFMNLSGTAVKPFLNKFDLSTSDLLVVHDDMDFPPGRAKMRIGGGGGGHKGVLSLIEHCGEDFARLKIGIGRPENYTEDNDIDWVLGKPSGSELEIIDAIMPLVASVMRLWIEQGPERSMTSFNTAIREIFSAIDEPIQGQSESEPELKGEGSDG